MALTARKGHAASVRRQSRQRLRSDRRYRRNRFLLFYRHLVRTGSAFPRLPRRFAPRNDNSEVHTILTIACTGRQHCAGPGCPLPYNGVYNHREYPEICSCLWRSLSAATDAIGFYVFIGTLYELEVPSRDCHVGRWPPRNDKPLAFTVLSIACTGRQHCAGPGCPLPYNARPKACVFFSLHFSVFRIHFHAPAPLQRISGGPAKNSTLRVSRFLPQIFPFLCITACTGGETCCGEGQHAWNRSCAVCPTGPTRAR